MPQPDKPLGRGLEQISHLFLTPKPHIPPPVHDRPGIGRAALLQPSKAVAKDLLVGTAKDNPESLEEGLRILDMFVPCHPHSDIDLLAIDKMNQLLAIDFETNLSDALVLRGLGHCDWLRNNIVNIRRMYPGYTLEAAQPRLFLIAPRFSPLALQATRLLAQLHIRWLRYQAFDMGSTTAIFFEPIA